MFRLRFLAALLLVALFATVAGAAPPLSTIQDVLYKADGTKFTGVVTIEWTSFQAVDTSNIATHSVTLRIVDGVLSVQLVPTTNASGGAFYSVRYTSDGKVQFTERWAVRPSTTPLKLRDVRVSSITSATASGLATLVVADVTGLPQELDLRPVKGSNYTPNRTAVINESGAIESVSGNLSDCVHVDGTSSPCGSGGGGSAGVFLDAETPAGNVDGSNGTFTLASTPSPAASLALYRNGVLQKQGFDYALSSNAISFVSAAIPQPGDVLLASYRSDGTSSGALTVAQPQVLCGGTGTSSGASTFTALATCNIPAGTLAAGDRVEIRADYAHTGAGGWFYSGSSVGNHHRPFARPRFVRVGGLGPRGCRDLLGRGLLQHAKLGCKLTAGRLRRTGDGLGLRSARASDGCRITRRLHGFRRAAQLHGHPLSGQLT